ncbi:MAG: 16S rRNA (uracil(1498)-N(3))-methyltransferase [Cyanobacteria bacterium CRU_2_1]|nr:16S rRNA (uracil(1498)-N(3))-methyltransferase [Cyanobacteria bacterium RU_5_0]NJR57532.1 16S rRNA (uracil(1498)-N(3))-methyltransferase [Cyanobacteria bacterium CRU_2_1]
MTQLQRLTIASSQLSDGQISLAREQQHYLSRVLRLRQGDRFIAIITMNGQGHWWLAALSDDPSHAEILEPISVQTELPIAITLLMAMPKSGMDEIVRQATELGVTQILPVISDRTFLKPSPQKLDRWQRIAQEAAEQSERQIVPKILSPQSWAIALQTWNATHSTCYLCECRGNYPHLLTCLISPPHPPMPSSPRPFTLAIGPEGGWTDAEIEQAIAAGYQPVSLGSRILRAITAPIAALSLIASVFEVMPDRRKSV